MEKILVFLAESKIWIATHVPYFEWVDKLKDIPEVIFWFILIPTLIFLIAFLRTIIVALRLGGFKKLGWFGIAGKIRKRGKKAELLNIKVLENSKLYSHLWSEYKDTLHELKRKDGGKEYRATLPAEAFFTKEILVDSRFLVWNDFFRHLPGILTGLGIIGTFFGLITGLDGFTPSEDAGSARQSLTALLHGVKEAFHLSAFAISAAILVTVLEKTSLTWAYKNVENIQHAIDELYAAGAGEEYLARLVEADETNSAQTGQLKDALVNDLRVLLTELTDRQVDAIGQLEGSINIKMGELNESLGKSGETTNDHLKNSLDSLMTAFLAKMNETLGTQMQQISSSLQQSSQVMQQVQLSLDGLVSNIAKTTNTMVEDMITKMEIAMKKAAINQEQMTQKMSEFVEQLNKRMEDQQTTSHQTMQKALEDLMQSLQQGQSQTHESINQHISQLLNKFDASIESASHTQTHQSEHLVKNIEVIATQVSDVTASIQTNIGELQNITQSMIDNSNISLEKTRQQTLENQQQLTHNMGNFIKETQESIQRQQTASQQQTHTLLEKMLDSLQANQLKTSTHLNSNVEQLFTKLHDKIAVIAESQKAQQQQLISHMDKLLKETNSAIAGMQTNTTELRRTTTEAITGMNSGADNIKGAADYFTKAGQSVSSVLEKATPMAIQMKGATESLSQVSTQLNHDLVIYQKLRDETLKHISELENLIRSIKDDIAIAKQESHLKKDLIKDMERIIDGLHETEKYSSEYLNKINTVLQTAFKQFGDSMKNQLSESLSQSDEHIGKGMSTLSGIIEELAIELKKLRR